MEALYRVPTAPSITVRMAQSTSTTPPKKRTAPDTEAASFLSQFYQTESTERDMKISRSVPETHHKERGLASTSACRRKDAEGPAQDLNERQHPRDMPAVVLVKDTGESKTLWSPSEATDRGPHDQDVADLEGKVSETMRLMHLTIAKLFERCQSHPSQRRAAHPVSR
ncbi:MAG: hypothetical protein Q9204_004958 [Flavoplaca sp. TL-2023a]